MKLYNFTKENLVDLELRRTRAAALKAIRKELPDANKIVAKYNRAAENYNNLYPAYPLGKIWLKRNLP